MSTEQSLSELVEEWKLDSAKLADSDIDIALDLIPKLHQKYVGMMSSCVFASKKAMGNYLKMRKLKFQYFRGDLNADTDLLKSLGWVPQQKKIDNSHIKEYLDGDDKLVELKLIAEQYSELAEHCKEILKAVNARGYGLQAKSKWKMFLHDGSE